MPIHQSGKLLHPLELGTGGSAETRRRLQDDGAEKSTPRAETHELWQTEPTLAGSSEGGCSRASYTARCHLSSVDRVGMT